LDLSITVRDMRSSVLRQARS